MWNMYVRDHYYLVGKWLFFCAFFFSLSFSFSSSSFSFHFIFWLSSILKPQARQFNELWCTMQWYLYHNFFLPNNIVAHCCTHAFCVYWHLKFSFFLSLCLGLLESKTLEPRWNFDVGFVIFITYKVSVNVFDRSIIVINKLTLIIRWTNISQKEITKKTTTL